MQEEIAMKDIKPKVDRVLSRIADYVLDYKSESTTAYEMARYCLLDSIACALNAQHYPECRKLLGPVVPNTTLPGGVRVPGTQFELDPIKAAFDISTSIRWLEHNDSWFGKDGGHPSDNTGAIISVADYLCRKRAGPRQHKPMVKDVLTALIKAYEIQGQLLSNNDLISFGLDSISTVNVASSAVATAMLGGNRDQVINAVSNAFVDGISPRIYRIGHAAGTRKAWAAGDAASRGVMHGLMAVRGEAGYPAALSTPKWGLSDAMLKGSPVVIGPLKTHIVENVLFKVPFPAQFHTQTASECALKLHPLVKARIADIKAIRMRTHEKTLVSAYKTGPLTSASSRDHCVQYVAAIVLLKGGLTSEDYEDKAARDPRIDFLRDRMTVTEDKSYTAGYYDTRLRTNTNSMVIEFNDGSSTPEIRIDYPLGHARRRHEGLPLVDEKVQRSIAQSFSLPQQRRIHKTCADVAAMQSLPFDKFMSLFVKQ